jgi:phosphoribosylglycinamide formyltransferase 2
LLASAEGTNYNFSGVTKVLENSNTDVRLFAIPTTRPYRRMGVVLTYDNLQSDVNAVKQKAMDLSTQITIISN